MSDMNTAPAPIDQQPMSPIGRVFGVFWEPGRTFRDIVAKPSWLLPVILMVAFGLIFIFAMQQSIGIETMMRAQFDRSPQLQNMSTEQREQILAMQMRFIPIFMYVGVLIGAPVFYLVVALVLMYAFRIIRGSEVKFKQAFGITTHAFLPTMISGIMAVLVMQFINPADFDMQNPVMSNLGWLAGNDAAAWMKALLGSFDLFSFWVMILLAIGFAATKKKLSTGSAFATILPFWILMVLFRVGTASLQG